jgi:hypothetical protein
MQFIGNNIRIISHGDNEFCNGGRGLGAVDEKIFIFFKINLSYFVNFSSRLKKIGTGIVGRTTESKFHKNRSGESHTLLRGVN